LKSVQLLFYSWDWKANHPAFVDVIVQQKSIILRHNIFFFLLIIGMNEHRGLPEYFITKNSSKCKTNNIWKHCFFFFFGLFNKQNKTNESWKFGNESSWKIDTNSDLRVIKSWSNKHWNSITEIPRDFVIAY